MRATGPLFTQSFPPSEILLTKQFNSRREAQHFQNFIQLANKFSYLKAILGCEQARNYIPLLILAKLLPSRKTGSPYTFQTKKLKYIVEYEGHKLIINADATFELAN
jgi:hypothetical protein